MTIRALLPLMLKEEYRLHTAYSSKYAFILFPFLVLLFSFIAALSSGDILANLGTTTASGLKNLLFGVHISIFIYGISVGAFGFLGRQYIERRYGKLNFLISTPSLLPLSYKKAFLSLYLRDVIFYVILMLVPVAGGLLLSIPLTNFQISSVLLLFGAAFLSFLYGLSLSFFVSVIYIRNVSAFITLISAFGILIGTYTIFKMPPVELLLPSLGLQDALPPVGYFAKSTLFYLILAIGAILFFTTIAVRLVGEIYESKKSYFHPVFPTVERKLLPLSKKWAVFIAKEYIDLKRSGTFQKMIFSYLLPLMFLTGTIWFVNYGMKIPIGFNTVFYASMLGFFAVLLYSWLTNTDVTDYYATLPFKVPKIIKAKLITFLLFTIWISAVFVVAIAIITAELERLWLALPVLVVVSTYMGTVTAYLTGLRTSTFLFDPGVLIKFSVYSLLPSFCLTVLSFGVDNLFAIGALGVVCLILIYATICLYKKIDEKWYDEEFG